MLVGTYVGCATVGAFVAWYMFESFLGIDLSQDGHSTVTWYQLTHWNQCPTWKGFTVSHPLNSSVLCSSFQSNKTGEQGAGCWSDLPAKHSRIVLSSPPRLMMPFWILQE